PGSAARRLPTTTGAPGLFIAGAWTDTGWPATMEGAVRSGLAAGRAVESWRRTQVAFTSIRAGRAESSRDTAQEASA
ncbi:MAG: hypothetical protein QOH29_2476, partial [Actinomycetota bacterium]|nr:hypothetical protein [Actinomycetota bacterium]